MLAKHVAIGLVISGLMAGTALAQSSKGEWRASKVVGVNVYNDSNEKLGSIDELIMNKDGKIDKVIIGVGGFLGVGQRDIAVNFDQLKFTDQPVPSNTASTAPPSSSTSPGSSTSSSSSSTVGASTSSSRTTADEWYPDHAVMSATKDQLKSMPEFKYTESTSSSSTSSSTTSTKK
jgi:sporulation protein YlmC with PRC-barrel domain